MSAFERSGWRDQEISERHRLYGQDCPAIDIDFLLAEYDRGEPVALIEYKHRMARIPKLSEPSYRAIISLANRAGLPAFLAYYEPETWTYWVRAINPLGRTHLAETTKMNEHEFYVFLCHLRQRPVEQAIMSKLKQGANDQE